jgi:L-fuculose-phosphate aldolase
LFYDEETPDAILEISPEYAEGLHLLKPGEEIIVITWLHQGDRSILQVHPRGNKSNPLSGVFLTRSADRPNPLGLHRVKVLEINSVKIYIDAIEAIDGTPVVDIKPIVHTNHD